MIRDKPLLRARVVLCCGRVSRVCRRENARAFRSLMGAAIMNPLRAAGADTFSLIQHRRRRRCGCRSCNLLPPVECAVVRSLTIRRRLPSPVHSQKGSLFSVLFLTALSRRFIGVGAKNNRLYPVSTREFFFLLRTLVREEFLHSTRSTANVHTPPVCTQFEIPALNILRGELLPECLLFVGSSIFHPSVDLYRHLTFEKKKNTYVLGGWVRNLRDISLRVAFGLTIRFYFYFFTLSFSKKKKKAPPRDLLGFYTYTANTHGVNASIASEQTAIKMFPALLSNVPPLDSGERV